MKTLFCFLYVIFIWHCNAQISDFNHINFSKADSIAQAYKGENLKNLPNLAHKLTSNLDTEAEQFRAIYMWVCNNVANDYRLYLKNKKKRKKFENDSLKLEDWNESFKNKLFSKLRKRKKTICSGYSYIISELSKLSDINCVMVNGFGRTSTTTIDTFNAANHSWNAVKLNGKWYLCDATWASGIVHPVNYGFKFDYNNGFFLTDPEFFAVTHFPIETKWMLLDAENMQSFGEFLKNPILYNNAYKYLTTISSPTKMHHELNENDKLKFEYTITNKLTKKDVTLIIDNGFRTKTVNPNHIKIDGDSLAFEYQFVSKDFYDVHFLLGSEYIATYTVNVQK